MRYRIINKMTREKILMDAKYRNMSAHTLDAVIQETCRLRSIGGIVRGTPHRFLCIIQRMEAMGVSGTEVAEMLGRMKPVFREGTGDSRCSRQRLSGNVYLIATLLFYLRLLEGLPRHLPLFRAFLMDYRKICVDEGLGPEQLYLDVFVDDLLNKTRMFDVHLSSGRAPK
jgi:pre-mRNA-splicing factor 38A